jgi:hypothetical protein
MPVAATTRTVLFVRPRPRPWTVAWTRFVTFLVLVSEVMRDAQALEREEHRKRPFISW